MAYFYSSLVGLQRSTKVYTADFRDRDRTSPREENRGNFPPLCRVPSESFPSSHLAPLPFGLCPSGKFSVHGRINRPGRHPPTHFANTIRTCPAGQFQRPHSLLNGCHVFL